MALMGAGREFVLKITADVKEAVDGIDKVSGQTKSMGEKIGGVGKSIASAIPTEAIIKFGTDSINAAADADDAKDAINAAFGSAGGDIEKFAKNAADNLGLSTAAYETMAAKTGNLLQSVGISNTDAADSTNILAQRAADMAAIWGTDVPTAMEAINKGLAGSTKGLQAFGVKLSSNEIDARAMSEGYVDASGKVTDAGKAIAAQELILEKTSNVQGAYADNSKDLGSQQDIMRAKMENLQSTIGQKLLPIITQLMSYAQPILNFLAANSGWLVPLAGVIAGVVVGIKAFTIAQTALNLVLSANPLGLIVIAIAAVVAGIVLLYTKVDWFRDFVDGAIDAVVGSFQTVWDIVMGIYHWVEDNWPTLLAILTGPIGMAVLVITSNWDTIKDAFKAAIDFVRDTMGTVWDMLTKPFRTAVDKVKTVIDEIPAAFRTAVTAIGTALAWVWQTISDPFKQGWDLAKSAGETVFNWFNGLTNGINVALSGLANVIKYPFVTAFNIVKDLWNNTIGSIHFTTPDWIPGIGGKGFSFPRMATGGIVTRPTIALIGEAGPEAVIPLNRFQAAPTAAPVIINVYALTASAEVGRQVYDSLREYERISGKAIA